MNYLNGFNLKVCYVSVKRKTNEIASPVVQPACYPFSREQQHDCLTLRQDWVLNHLSYSFHSNSTPDDETVLTFVGMFEQVRLGDSSVSHNTTSI